MRSEIIRTADGTLLAQVPEGWMSAMHDTLPPGVAAWLVNDERSGIIALREISLDRLAAERVRKEGLVLLARLSLSFRADSARPSDNVPIAEYEIGNVNVCSYELSSRNGEWKSVLVAIIGGRYYECEASSSSRVPEQNRRVAEAQKGFVASLATSSRG